MGKASRRKGADKKAARAARVPFAARPFEGLPGETSWVAMREILPAATARLSFSYDGAEHSATVATVLPLAWAGLHRSDGERFIATQSGAGSGDLSRDLAAALIGTVEAGPGEPVIKTPPVTGETPRLQDLLSADVPEIELHDGFDFWVEQDELDDATAASLEQANAAITPTVALPSTESAYWCRIGERTYVRWVLPHSEDEATAALARLHAAGHDGLDDGRLLGAFRTCGLLVPVWEVDAAAEGSSYDDGMEQLAGRFDEALASVRAGDALTDDERRARAGLVSRQITIR
ncbi:preprotein translocase SecA [Flexivirga endophytica]|uniref:Preprotein translocase SecA n=1 Tax=Flexivirga endophytica TaxID=1849103 RepID=A0A916T3W9_9MICO|nr:DUF5926 family protein [Flexivirga endophytica]GGB30993.1 preprotein translocase SecA [Flexivirga endophytica]GHB51932.1 preprotein translocase SecA [Flexivirga endophytica]